MSLQASRPHAAGLQLTNHDGRALMRQCLSQLRFSREYLQAWFCDAAVHDLRQGNIREFMAYGFWYTS